MPGHAFDSVIKNEFCFDLPMFSKYLATSINSYFYKMTLLLWNDSTHSTIVTYIHFLLYKFITNFWFLLFGFKVSKFYEKFIIGKNLRKLCLESLKA